MYSNKQHVGFRGMLCSMKGTELVKLLFASSKVNYYYMRCLFYSYPDIGTSTQLGNKVWIGSFQTNYNIIWDINWVYIVLFSTLFSKGSIPVIHQFFSDDPGPG